MAVLLDDYRPFDTGPGSANYAEHWRRWMNRAHESGVIATHKEPDTANELRPYADSTGMQVKVEPGECYIQGHWGWLQEEKIMGIEPAHATLDRIDRIVLRADYVLEQISVEVLTGVPGSGEPPALTYSLDRWEIKLCQVTVDAAVTTIAAGKIKDERDRAGFGMTSAHHVPALKSSSGPGVNGINMGAGSTSLCRYKREGHLLYIRWCFTWGTGPYNGGTGKVSTQLPDGMTARGQYWLVAHLWTHSPSDRDWLGQALIKDGESEVLPFFPGSPTEMRTGPYCIVGDGGYTQCPDMPGAGEDPEGGELTICGVLEVDYPEPEIPLDALPSEWDPEEEEPEPDPDPDPDPVERVTTYDATWSATWDRYGKGTDNVLYQGNHSYGAGGFEFSKIGFDAAQISADLDGAEEISKIEVYLRNAHAYYGSGLWAMIGTHENEVEPGPSNGWDRWDRMDRVHFARYVGKWVELPIEWAGEFQAGSTKGITLGHTVLGGQGEYGYFNRTGDGAPKLRITYTK